jgi:hypothetical protein
MPDATMKYFRVFANLPLSFNFLQECNLNDSLAVFFQFSSHKFAIMVQSSGKIALVRWCAQNEIVAAI